MARMRIRFRLKRRLRVRLEGAYGVRTFDMIAMQSLFPMVGLNSDDWSFGGLHLKGRSHRPKDSIPVISLGAKMPALKEVGNRSMLD